MSDFLTPACVADYLSAYKFKVELHAHTKPVSGCSDLPPETLIELLAGKKYDAVVLTNHYTFHAADRFGGEKEYLDAYIDAYHQTFRYGAEAGIRVYLGAEYRFTENGNDYLVFGTDEQFLRDTYSELDGTYADFYRKHRSDNLIIVQAHPFRDGIQRMAPSLMDGIESLNLHPHHNSRVSLATDYARANEIPLIFCGTDLHHVGHEGLCATRMKTLPADNAELVRALRSRDYLMDIGGCPLLPYASF